MRQNLPDLLAITLFLLLMPAAWAHGGTPAQRSAPQLEEMVLNLNLAYGGYQLGAALTAEQQYHATQHMEKTSHPGTYTFRDKALRVVARTEDHRVLALYQHFEKADRQQVKDTIGLLMHSFGEPTTVAHDKIIYWSYTPGGKLSETAFDKEKERNNGNIDIIASVKCSNSLPFDQASSPSTIYWILSSNKILEHFLASTATEQ